MPGAHKIGAAISGPRITGGNFMDTTLLLIDENPRIVRKCSATGGPRTRVQLCLQHMPKQRAGEELTVDYRELGKLFYERVLGPLLSSQPM